MAPRPSRRAAARPPFDVGALALAPLGIAVVVAAQVLGGVPASALLQAEAALVVVGGTIGVVLLSYAPGDVVRTVRAVGQSFRAAHNDVDALAATIMGLAVRAYRRGLVTIEPELDGVKEPFLREGLSFAIDEPSIDAVREVLQVQTAAHRTEDEAPARLLESAAGYTPTLGILGAVIGLIHVMRNLSEPGALGGGIAMAFVATVYGLGLANLVLLPLAGRLRERAALGARRRELMTHGVCAIHQRVHPRMLAQKLRACGASSAAVAERSARLTPANRGTRLPA